jgi:hypothetical protein
MRGTCDDAHSALKFLPSAKKGPRPTARKAASPLGGVSENKENASPAPTHASPAVGMRLALSPAAAATPLTAVARPLRTSTRASAAATPAPAAPAPAPANNPTPAAKRASTRGTTRKASEVVAASPGTCHSHPHPCASPPLPSRNGSSMVNTRSSEAGTRAAG